MRKDWMAGWTNWYFMRNLDVHRRLNLLRWPSLLFNELKMGLNNRLLYRFLFFSFPFFSLSHANLSPSATTHHSHMWASQQPILLQRSDTFEWLLIDHKRFFFGCFFKILSVSSSGTEKKSLSNKQICVCFLMNNWCAASLHACMCVWWCLHISVYPIVCLCVILSAYFKGVCVFSGQERTTEWLTLFPIARLRDCLPTAHLPARFIRNFMHAFGQLRDDTSLFPALNFPAASKENFSPGCKLAGWDYRFTHPEQIFVRFLEAFWKLFSSRCRRELPARFWQVQELFKIVFSHFYLLTNSISRSESEYLWGEGEALFSSLQAAY